MRQNWHTLSVNEVIKQFGSDPHSGLLEEEVKKRQQKFGLNKLSEEKPQSGPGLFLGQFRSFLIYILVVAGVVSLFLGDYTDAVVIFGSVFLSVFIGFYQENKTSNILHALKKIVQIKTFVLRDGNEKEIKQSELVPGDIFFLAAGGKVPADGRLIENFDLKVNESVFTGEWLASDKNTEILPEKTILSDRDNMVYMGCVVESGRGKAIVTETGAKTELGKLAELIRETKEEKTPYQIKINNLSKVIGIAVIVGSFLIFGLGILTEKGVLEMFLTSVAAAVGAIPEGLTVAITVILTLGMQRILKNQGLVRKMAAAETLGNTSIICTDKTGTLTLAQMQIAGIFTEDKELLSDGKKFTETIDKNGSEAHILALKIGMLCTEAFIENPEDELHKWIIRGRPMERALLLAGIQAGFSKKELEEHQPKIDEIFFDPVYKYSATLHHYSDKANVLYILGAPEIILKMSKMEEEKSSQLRRKIGNLAARGSRVLGCAYKMLPASSVNIEDSDFQEMTFVGFITLHDPIRKEVKEAINICRKAGARPIIVTGDHRMTAKAIGEELGFLTEDKNIIEGHELDKLDEEEFRERLKDIEIYARVEPRQKLKIVQAWQEKRKVVAMTGDGINDAPALKRADIGIALGSGTDVAKEASDLILLTDNFSIIAAAVEEGRAIIDNIRKVLTYMVAECFSEFILVVGSVIFNLPLLILPAQILWVNLIEGSPQGIALAFEPKEKDVMARKPEDPRSPLLNRKMKVIIFWFGIFTDVILFALCFALFRNGMPLDKVRTIAFVGLGLASFFYVFSCRNLRKNIWQYNFFSNPYLILSVLLGVLMFLAAIYIPLLQNFLKTVPLNINDWILLLILGMLNLILIELTKFLFIRNK